MSEQWGPGYEAELEYRREQLEAGLRATRVGAQRRRDRRAARRGESTGGMRGSVARRWSLRGSGAWSAAR
ncbi:hypothetical protein [Cellulomonas palmilytica]|uniref:hypothetical protein n=1 Tax=Cellulomonas palmilytica TaxID=2608402 RepID=UPI001F48CB6B|nr:hypothetical protein [Cellulomonas palmilytica]UJP38621.1 hypothetical protein F1D97_09290 [Cellulomonas palmilytica]